ncbi:MAG: carboxymuconolactone decarboxylase family protein [Gemmataceae bacterium]|nr:carboxymuconolactone decarboxylase family protein [Gemmataceae bacterium]
MLELDYRHRALSPLDPKLRARLRWVAARALGCKYSETSSAADLLRAGGTPTDLRTLAEDHTGLPEAERAALAFARKLVVRPGAAADREVARLVSAHGEKQVVAMVLLLAHATFQDRLLLALDLPPEPGGPLPPVEVRIASPPIGTSLAVPRKGPASQPLRPHPGFAGKQPRVDFAVLQKAVERQQSLRPRIRLPQSEPGNIHWGLVCRTYQPELAASWSSCRNYFGAEANQDAVFEASVFWVVAQAQESFY